jgi:hypothetical protein
MVAQPGLLAFNYAIVGRASGSVFLSYFLPLLLARLCHKEQDWYCHT